MDARDDTHSQLSELGQWTPERVTYYSQLSELGQWTPERVTYYSQLSKLGQWRPSERILIHSPVNWDNGFHTGMLPNILLLALKVLSAQD